MSFVNGDFNEAIDPPERLCPEKLGGILAAFPPVALPIHERAGARFNPPPCGQALALDPDFCLSTIKMDPQSWRPEREAILGALQSAVNCSFGVSDDDLRSEAENAIRQNLSRAIEADLVDALAAEATSGGIGHSAVCALAEAAMFLASQGECQTGIIIGPVGWMTALGKDYLVWNGKYHTDTNGNIVLSHSLDNDTVYAFDGGLIIKTSDVELLDEHMPGQRERNDRVVRAEMLYSIYIAPCAVGSWGFDCTAGSGGGGGGGGVQNPCNCQFEVTNFPANQNVTVTGPVTVAGPVPVTLDEPIDVNVTFPAEMEVSNDAGNPLTVTVTNPPTFSTMVDDEALCDDGGVFFRRVVDDGQGNRTVSFVDVAGAVYVPQGEVKTCTPDAPVILGEVCVTDPDFPAQTYRMTLNEANGGVEGPNDNFTFTNFDGSGVDVTINTSPSSGFANVPNNVFQLNPNGNLGALISFSQPVILKRLQVGSGNQVPATTFLFGFETPFTGFDGTLSEPVPGEIHFSNATNTATPDGEIYFNSVVEELFFQASSTPDGFPIWLFDLEFAIADPNAPIVGKALAIKCDGCEGGIKYINTLTGAEILSPGNIIPCPATATPVTLDEPIDVNVLNPVPQIDVEEEILCDDNGAFIRRFVFTDGVAGAPVDLDLSGAAYAPVGTVKVCSPSDCCPINIGEGCTSTGSGTYVSIRNGDGTISLIDPVTGSPVVQGDIVPCGQFTLVAEHRLIGDADPAWTSADVVGGTLTSITFTVLSGTATVVDSNGTSAAGLPAGVSNTWEVDPDSNGTLDSTNFSVDAIGGQTYVTWTVRT